MKKLAFCEGWTCNGKPVRLPHDAMISEKRNAKASDGGHGYFPGGIYTYEKRFTAPAEWENKKVLIEFEGVYRNCTVSLNGRGNRGPQIRLYHIYPAPGRSEIR